MAPEGLPLLDWPCEVGGGAEMGEHPLRPHRLPGHYLLCGAAAAEGAEQPR